MSYIEDAWDPLDHFLTGSYKRHTKTKKPKDVDIFVVVDPAGRQGSLAGGTGREAVLALRDVLATRWSDLDPDDNVATINYGDEDVASYEVAPVFRRAGGRLHDAEPRRLDGYGSTAAGSACHEEEQAVR